MSANKIKYPLFRRHMCEELRPVYLLPALKSVIHENRKIIWVMMGADTNYTAWNMLTSRLNIKSQPIPIKIKVGGPHHGDIDDPALYIISLLGDDELSTIINKEKSFKLQRWASVLKKDFQDKLVHELKLDDIRGFGNFSYGLKLSEFIKCIVNLGLHPELYARWKFVVPQYLKIMYKFERSDFSEIKLNRNYFQSSNKIAQKLLAKILLTYQHKLHQQFNSKADRLESELLINQKTFDLLRHSFSEVLGQQVVKLKGDSCGWRLGCLNVLLEKTHFGRILRNSPVLFWENGIWTGRTYLAIYFAVQSFYLRANWKFGVHTSYPYVKGIDQLADIKTSETLEGVEDVQGPGKYLYQKNKNSYEFVTYEEWINNQIKKITKSKQRLSLGEIDEHERLIKKIIIDAKPRLNSKLSKIITSEILVRIYLRAKNYRHPQEDNIIFKHFLHLVYFNQGIKQSYRSLYFPVQNFFNDLANYEIKQKNRLLFRRIRELDKIVRPYEEILVIKKWLDFRKIFKEQSRLGIEAISKYKKQVFDYLDNVIGFSDLVKLIVPGVEAINFKKYHDIISNSKNTAIVDVNEFAK